RWSRLRALRRVPASPKGIRGRRHFRPDRVRLTGSRRVYTVKEIFFTLQGEGANAGRPAVFCRFTGCNLWTGHEADRDRAICRFCDTDFVGVSADGGRFDTADALADAI